MTRQKLVGTGEPVIRKVVAAAMRDRVIDQTNESALGILYRGGRMVDVQIEYHTRIRIVCPWKSTFRVRLDEADRAVDEVDGVTEKVAPHIIHEGEEAIARHVQLGDHFTAAS